MDKIIVQEVSKHAVTSPEALSNITPETIELSAENCIKRHVIAAMGIGLIPSAVLDVAGITAIEVKMIRDLAKIYNFPVPNRLVAVKALISLIGSIGPVYLSTKMHAALKGVPLLGYAVFAGLLSITGGAAVYGVGKIFQKHFESGGIFLNSENLLIRDYFKKQYREGKRIAKQYVGEMRDSASTVLNV